jgi:hypothetical protein
MNDPDERIAGLLGDHPQAADIARAFAALDACMRGLKWFGACHSTSAVAWLVLNESGVDALACLGEVGLYDGSVLVVAWDHSWIEIDGRPFDVAVSMPADAALGFQSLGVFGGIELYDGQPPQIRYGVQSGRGFDAFASRIVRLSLEQFIEESIGKLPFPGYPQGLWDIARDVATNAGVAFNLERARKAARSARWTLRP